MPEDRNGERKRTCGVVCKWLGRAPYALDGLVESLVTLWCTYPLRENRAS